MLGDFEQGDAKRPDVRGDGVGLARDTLGGHIVGCANEGVGITLSAKLATDTEIAEPDLAGAGKKNIGWFDIWCGSAKLV